MNWVKAMKTSIDYMEEHLMDEINITEIAKAATASPFHYQRMFYMLTGISVQEYVRNRRLSMAAGELISTDMKVIDLAVKYGYETSESFSRAFKKVHGANPSVIRKGEGSIKAFPRLTIQLTLKGDVPMNYRIEKKEAFSFYGMTREFTTVDGQNFVMIPKWWQEAMGDGSFGRMMEKSGKDTCLGVCMPMDPEKDTEFDYVIGSFTEAAVDGYDNYTVPEAEWAVFTLEGPISETIQDTWKRIFSEWFPETGFKHAPAPELEVYLGGDVNAPDYVMEIWIPVERG